VNGRPNHAATTNAAAAAADDTANPPVISETKPASAGPTIWPTPNAPVITAITRRESTEPASSLPRIKPRAVRPMNVPPTNTAATQMPTDDGQTTDASTPAASANAAIPNALARPIRRPRKLQNQTEGEAARPTTIQITGSRPWTAGVARTIATRNVAVMT